MQNHWIITKDHIPDGSDRTGYKSPSFPQDLDPNSLPIKFRMYDDDGNLYYEGRMTEADFEPLDDFGRPDAGCTELRFLNNNQWEIL